MAVEDTWRCPDGSHRDRYGIGLQWRARWREGGKSRSKSFRTKKAAERWLVELELRPTRVPEVTMDAMLDVWIKAKAGLTQGTRTAAA